MKKTYLLFSIMILLAVGSNFSYAEKTEKKPYTLDDAMKAPRAIWHTMSDYGNWIGYTVRPDRGDMAAYIHSTGDSLINYHIERGRKIYFSPDEKYAATLISPKAIDKENKVKDKSKLKNGMTVIELESGRRSEHKNVKSFKFMNNSRWMMFIHNTDKSAYKSKKDKPKGSEFVLKHLESNTDIRIDYVNDFVYDSTSRFIFYSVSSPDGERDGLYYRDFSKVFAPEFKIAGTDSTVFSNLAYNHKKRVLAFTESQMDKKGKPDSTEFKIWLQPNNQVVTIIAKDSMPADYFLPHKNEFKWTDDGKRLFFGFKPLIERDTTSDDGDDEDDKYTDENYYDMDFIEEKADVLVWHWDDERIVPAQIKWWNDNKDRVFTAVYHLETNKWLQLGTLEMPGVEFTDNPKYALIHDDKPYRKLVTWEGWFMDIWTIDLNTGEKNMIVPKVVEPGHISNNGEFVVYFKSKNWWSYNNTTKQRINHTGKMKPEFFDNTGEIPAEPGSFGFLGWHKDDVHFYVYDEYDCWRFNTADDGFINLFAADGRRLDRKYRIKVFDEDKKFFTMNDTLLVECYYNKKRHTNLGFMTMNICGAEMFYLDSLHTNKYRDKAKYASKYLFTREAYDLYPDLWVGSFGMEDRKQLTDIYPEMKNFEWGSTERVVFQNSKGDDIKGYIIKPENFDPNEKHPLLVYIYEKFANRTYRYYQPGVHHRPCYQVYNSLGYVVFVPDIKYGVGNPGKDALDCVMSGVDFITSKGYIDTTAMCLQGHSWGAYQGAYIATQTDRFAAIAVGAPVGNMTSAYSGIRLTSGLARQFQYEKYQSRIGASIFESLENYIANSPVFEASKAEVPLLVLHGDVDGAVPWEQSIELYLAYRRLGKNCIFLQYENEPHWPGRYPNKVDWAKKTLEFFNTYCLGTEAPKWIKEGEPYYNKW